MLEQIQLQEQAIEENEKFFEDNYKSFDTELGKLYGDMQDEEIDLDELRSMIKESTELLK